MSLLQLLLTYASVLVGVSIAVKSHMAMAALIKENIYSSEVQYGRERGSMQADMVPEK